METPPPEPQALFDLPLAAPEERAARRGRGRRNAGRRVEAALPLFTAPAETVAPIEAAAPVAPRPRPVPPPAPVPKAAAALAPAAVVAPHDGPAAIEPVGLGRQLAAAAADFAVHLVVLALVVAGALRLGLRPGVEQAAPLVLFFLAFSFLYAVVPLAFWGRTPGMAWSKLVARSGGRQSLTFRQTVLRWLAGVLTILSCGLALLVALSGSSLADRMSGSRTLSGVPH